MENIVEDIKSLINMSIKLEFVKVKAKPAAVGAVLARYNEHQWHGYQAGQALVVGVEDFLRWAELQRPELHAEDRVPETFVLRVLVHPLAWNTALLHGDPPTFIKNPIFEAGDFSRLEFKEAVPAVVAA